MRSLYSREIQLEEDAEIALFYGDIRTGEVVASTSVRASASDFMSAGVNILNALQIDRAEFLSLTQATDKTIAAVTGRGLAIISPVFYLSSGLYIYAHVGGRQASLPRVLGHLGSCGYAILGEGDGSPMRDEDIPTLRAAEDIIRELEDIRSHIATGYDYADDTALKNIFELQRLLGALCRFCGVDASVTVKEDLLDAYASAGDMRTLVSSCLVCISAAKAVAVDAIKVSIGTEDGFWTTEFELTYRQRAELPAEEARRYLELTAALTGMKFTYSSHPVPRPQKFKRGKFASMRLVLLHSSNPDIGIAWGVKAGNILLENDRKG